MSRGRPSTPTGTLNLDQPLQKLEQLEQAIEETIAQAIPPQGRWRAAARIAGWALLALYFLFAAALLSLRYWILPKVAEYRGDIEQYASKALGQRITIGAIEADWQGLRPELLLANVTVFDHDGRAALSLPAVEATLAWISALVGSPRFYSLVFDRPRLEIRRDEAGRFYVAGIELHAQQAGDAGIAQWVLSQRELVIGDASLSWDEKLRGAPLLELRAFNFVLRHGFLGHRFAFKAKPPPELASALDVRGELDALDVGDPGACVGQVYAELEYTDLVAWRRWVDYPFDIRSGKGGLRLWLNRRGKASSELRADVALSQVLVGVSRDTPLLELDYLQGRVGASQRDRKGFEVSGSKLTLKTGTGIVVPPADFRVRWTPAEGATPAGGEIDADGIDLAPLARLAEYLPFPRAARARLEATEPRGSVLNLKAAWTGDAEDPQHYSARGGFARLAARAHDGIPGFAGLTGRFETSEKGGNVVPGSGIFSVVAKVTDADLRYADGWPQASGISGDLIFEGKSMRVAASKASVLGVQASSVRASIPDLFHDAHVEVEVRAEDQTSDFLRFIAQSPVTEALDGVTDGMSAAGKGRLALHLDIPIGNPATFKLACEYLLVDNEIRADPDLPPFSHLNGRFEFTESAVTAREVSAQFRGGPTRISVATRADGLIAVNAQGTASAAQIPRAWGEGLLQRVSGATAWQGTITGAHGRPVTFIVQSQLTGVAVDLPPPLGKTAVEPMPLRFERVIDPAPATTDMLKLALGRAVEAAIQRRRDGPAYVVDRGVISLNEPAVLSDREGLTVTGSLH